MPNKDTKLLRKIEEERRDADRMYSRGGDSLECLISEMNDDIARLENQMNRTFYAFINRVGMKEIKVMLAYDPEKIKYDEVRVKISEMFRVPVDAKTREVTIGEFSQSIESSRFVSRSPSRVLDEIGSNIEARDSFFEPGKWSHEEMILADEKLTKSEVYARAGEMLASDSMLEELDRIYSTANTRRY